MVFSSTVFLFLFLPGLLLVYYLPSLIFKKDFRAYKNFVLLMSSLFFYAWGEPAFVFVMLISVLFNWLMALLIENFRARKFWLIVAVSFNILLLFVFKYASFVSRNLALLTGNEKLVINILLPVGISFFTFQMMSYVFDVYYKISRAQKNPLYTALYITLFPQLIAGPIVRYRDIEREILNRRETFEIFSSGVNEFIYGLAKKVLIANFMARIAYNVFDYINNPSVLMAWLGAIAYTLQIYFDFSGYSDMAIGLGRMFGFNFNINFNYPYVASSVQDFWRRWHISLSSWFRDYVYIPMGGNRVSKSRWILNIFIVWLLTGAWHGANWTFILWGLIYFVFLLLEHEIKIKSHVYAMLIVILAWVIFRSKNIFAGINYIACMFGLKGNIFYDAGFIEYIKGSFIVLIIACVGSAPVVHKFLMNNKRLEQIWLVIIFIISLLEVISSSYNPFIYFNF